MLKLLALLALFGLAVPALGVGGRTGGRRLGGWNPADTTDEGVVAAAQFAFEQLRRRDNGMYALKMAEIVSAERQIVAGIKYRVTINVHTTDCRAGPAVDLSTCASTHTQQCVMQVFHRAWGPDAGMRDGGSQCSAKTALLPGSE